MPNTSGTGTGAGPGVGAWSGWPHSRQRLRAMEFSTPHAAQNVSNPVATVVIHGIG
jgi:hypothetical protein